MLAAILLLSRKTNALTYRADDDDTTQHLQDVLDVNPRWGNYVLKDCFLPKVSQ